MKEKKPKFKIGQLVYQKPEIRGDPWIFCGSTARSGYVGNWGHIETAFSADGYDFVILRGHKVLKDAQSKPINIKTLKL